MKPIVNVVCGVLTNSEGQVLIAKRSEAMGHGGNWEFAGGKIETGETPQEALIRELKEELEIDIQVGSCIGYFDHDYGAKIVRLFAYFASTDQVPIPLEHDELLWVNPLKHDPLTMAASNVPIFNQVIIDKSYEKYMQM